MAEADLGHPVLEKDPFYEARLIHRYDIYYVVHASIQYYLGSERAAAIEHLKSLEALNIYPEQCHYF